MDMRALNLPRLIILLVVATLIGYSISLAAYAATTNSDYLSAVVMNARSGQVLYAEHPHKRVIPASLVKMMLLLITMEKLEAGRMSLADEYQVSAAASRIGGHQVYLKQGEVFTLGELLKAVVISSANDAAFAIAEHLAGSQANFVKLMNGRAQALSMRNTVFANAHGLPPNRRKGKRDNYTTAYDLALLSRELAKYPLIMKWASTRLDSFRAGTFQLLNTNHRFLRQFDGADGLKTGYHSRGAGFSMVGTAVRQERRLLAVVMGSKTAKARLNAVTHLLQLGFAGKLARASS